MKKGEKKSATFAPYEVGYVESLLKMVNADVQDNAPIGGENYLKMAVAACQEFNAEFAERPFDMGEDD